MSSPAQDRQSPGLLTRLSLWVLLRARESSGALAAGWDTPASPRACVSPTTCSARGAAASGRTGVARVYPGLPHPTSHSCTSRSRCPLARAWEQEGQRHLGSTLGGSEVNSQGQAPLHRAQGAGASLLGKGKSTEFLPPTSSIRNREGSGCVECVCGV